jgi:hypothetical protein
VGSEPGSSRFHLFSHFHHFTAEPQRLPHLKKLSKENDLPMDETSPNLVTLSASNQLPCPWTVTFMERTEWAGGDPQREKWLSVEKNLLNLMMPKSENFRWLSIPIFFRRVLTFYGSFQSREKNAILNNQSARSHQIMNCFFRPWWEFAKGRKKYVCSDVVSR